jgi:hypothetical protein
MTGPAKDGASPLAARMRSVSHVYKKTRALDDVTLDFPTGKMIGLIGPDGVGKSTLLSLIAGARKVQQGEVEALGADMRDTRQRNMVGPRIAYMPRQLRNLTVWRISLADAQRIRDWPAHAFHRCRRTGASAIRAGRSFRSARISSPSCCGSNGGITPPPAFQALHPGTNGLSNSTAASFSTWSRHRILSQPIPKSWRKPSRTAAGILLPVS